MVVCVCVCVYDLFVGCRSPHAPPLVSPSMERFLWPSEHTFETRSGLLTCRVAFSTRARHTDGRGFACRKGKERKETKAFFFSAVVVGLVSVVVIGAAVWFDRVDACEVCVFACCVCVRVSVCVFTYGVAEFDTLSKRFAWPAFARNLVTPKDWNGGARLSLMWASEGATAIPVCSLWLLCREWRVQARLFAAWFVLAMPPAAAAAASTHVGGVYLNGLTHDSSIVFVTLFFFVVVVASLLESMASAREGGEGREGKGRGRR